MSTEDACLLQECAWKWLLSRMSFRVVLEGSEEDPERHERAGNRKRSSSHHKLNLEQQQKIHK